MTSKSRSHIRFVKYFRKNLVIFRAGTSKQLEEFNLNPVYSIPTFGSLFVNGYVPLTSKSRTNVKKD